MSLEKPYKTKAQRKKGSWDHLWPRKRSLNIENMIKRMRKDEAYLFEMASTLLNTFADVPWKLGDENMSILMAWIAAQLTSKQWDIENKRKRSKKKVLHKR